jgi:hypothetical protein
MAQHLRILEVADDVPHTAEAGAARASLGLRGTRRLTHLVLVLALFAARVWIKRRGWFGRHSIPPSNLRHREGVVLRDKLIALGPTFIKLGQMLAMRLDLLPVEYLQTLSSLQDAGGPIGRPLREAVVALPIQPQSHSSCQISAVPWLADNGSTPLGPDRQSALRVAC